MAGNILRLKPLEFAQVLDLNLNVTYVEIGPRTLILQDNQSVVHGPAPFVIIPPGHYCTVINPAKLPVDYGKQAELNFGHSIVRFNQEPFPLYPGEVLVGAKVDSSDYAGAIKKLPVVPAGKALRLEALTDFMDKGVQRIAGDEWQIEGPCTYFPQPEVKASGKVESVIISYMEALHLRAKRDLVDKDGNKRVTGEEWLHHGVGSYLPGVHEQIVSVVSGHTLTLYNALHMIADKNLVDGIGKKRYALEEYLVTVEESSFYIPEVGERVVEKIIRLVLAKQQFCVVINPVDSNGHQVLGKRELRKGECSFFLKPGEYLEDGIVDAYLLEDDEALTLKAMDDYSDETGEVPIQRHPGEIWMINGPLVYIPTVEVQVQDRRKPIALSENEGIYVQDCKTGKVKTVTGPQSYLLKETEALWEKELSIEVERMLKNGGCYGEGDIRKLAYFEVSIDPKYASGNRDKTRAVTYRAPTNCAVQVFDHQKQTARVVFGPNLIMLGPSEEFNVLTLSAGKPKKQFALECLAIMLGPDYLSDIIEVETLDHARLRIMYAANNKFEYEVGNADSEKQLFSVPDYIGFATRNMASRIRAAVARTCFDDFHRHSTKIITEAVFGKEASGELRRQLKFPDNNMIVTNIDIQSIEPVDTHMRDSLLKSVQLAIEISTQSIEMAAEHEAAKNGQVARGNLERNKLDNEKAAENARMNLYSLRAITAAVESSGQATAEAAAQAEKLLIEGTSAIEVASLKMQAEEIEESVKLDNLEKQREAEVEYTRVCNELAVEKAKNIAEIEKEKTRKLIDSIGKNTIQNIALAGPAAQIHMLQGLGIRGTLITDGSTPVNLYQAGNGMISPMIQH